MERLQEERPPARIGGQARHRDHRIGPRWKQGHEKRPSRGLTTNLIQHFNDTCVFP